MDLALKVPKQITEIVKNKWKVLNKTWVEVAYVFLFCFKDYHNHLISSVIEWVISNSGGI